jgi:hypothetical protein
MQKNNSVTSSSDVTGKAWALCMMAFFTLLWTIIAYKGLQVSMYGSLLLIFPFFSTVFVFNAIKLFRAARQIPKLLTQEDITREKKRSKWFSMIFIAEGLGIFIAVNLVINIGHPELQIPAIALIVGLHFFPLAKLFNRVVDYYLASYSTIVAITGIILAAVKIFNENQIFVFTGIGLAISTVAYGISMMASGKKALARTNVI